eukprot:GFUD01073727.1.p1 GENE.GFUD01073727.1~~GFUD01073727.1.p1  ORF type:complete len:147 (+),score=33.88 GFUD01073727.1:43-441(+)
MAGVDSEIKEKVEMLRRGGSRFPEDGHSYNRKDKNYGVTGTHDHFHISGNIGHFERFVETFVVRHPEMLTWDRGVYYSMNKNKRWNITEEMKNAIENNLEDFVDHESDITVVIKSELGLYKKSGNFPVYRTD